MGCDIHPAIEVCERADDIERIYGWRLVAVPDSSRNYEFFSLLAGVRGEHEPWVARRGLPPHLDWHTRGDEDEGLGIVNGEHSASWFTLAEARTFVVPAAAEMWAGRQWDRWLRTMEFFRELYDVPPEQVRAVFNFDS